MVLLDKKTVVLNDLLSKLNAFVSTLECSYGLRKCISMSQSAHFNTNLSLNV